MIDSPIQESKDVFTSTVEDDDGKEFKIVITTESTTGYVYQEGWTTFINEYSYDVMGSPHISETILNEMAREIIGLNFSNHVVFEVKEPKFMRK